jgi:purine-binding chemotaxis protein CheW
MRPLPIEPVAGTPPFVRGISVIRGAAVPVVDLTVLLDRTERRTEPRRFVTVKTEERQFALAVDDVVGVRDLDPARLEALPPLLRTVEADQIETIGVADARLLLVLRGSRIVPADVWQTIAAVR